MKQTNNALNLLNASYQAVFKHAYITGLASGVALLSIAPYAYAADTDTAKANFKTTAAEGQKFNYATQLGTHEKFSEPSGYAKNIQISGDAGQTDSTGLTIDGIYRDSDVFFQTGAKITNAFLNIEGGDTFEARLVGSFDTDSTEITGNIEFNNAKLNISQGKVLVNQADFTSGTEVTISGLAGNNGHTTTDNLLNYSALRTGQVENKLQGQAGATNFNNFTLELGTFSALDAMGDVSFERGVIKINADKDSNGTEYAHGELAAKAVIRADNFNLNTSSTLQVNTDKAGAIYAQKAAFNSGSTVTLQSGSQLQIAGQLSQTLYNKSSSASEGSKDTQYLDTNIADGSLKLNGSLDNSGSLILGGNSIDVKAASYSPSSYAYEASKFDVEQTGTVNNFGTLSLGEALAEGITSNFNTSKGTNYSLEGGTFNNEGQIDINQGSKLQQNSGTFDNKGSINIANQATLDIQNGIFKNGTNGLINLQSGGSFNIAANAISGHKQTYSITQGEKVVLADVNYLGKINAESGSNVTLKNGIFTADRTTANSLGASLSNALISGSRVGSGTWTVDNATLQLASDLDLSSAHLAETNIQGQKNAVLATTGDLSFTGTSSSANNHVGTLNGFSKVQGGEVTVNRVAGDSYTNIWLKGEESQKTLAATKSLTTSDGARLGIGHNMALELTTEQFDTSVNDKDSADARTPEAHQVKVDLTIAEGGQLNVTADPWIAQNITTVSGSQVEINGQAQNSKDEAFKTHAQLTATSLDFDGAVTVSNGASLVSTNTTTLNEHAFVKINDSNVEAQNLVINGSDTVEQPGLNLDNSTAAISQTVTANNGKLNALDATLTAKDFVLSNGAVISFTNSDVTIHNKLDTDGTNKANKFNLNHSNLSAEQIELNANSTLTALSGSVVTVNSLRNKPASTLNESIEPADNVQADFKESTLTIKGDNDTDTADLNVKLTLNQSKLNLGDALDSIGLRYQEGVFKVNNEFQKIIANESNIAMDLSNSNLNSIDAELKQELFEQVFDTHDSAENYLSLTGITSSDITTSTDADGNVVVDFGDLTGGGDLDMDYDTDTTKEAILTNVDASKNISGGWKAIRTANDQLNPVNVAANKTLQIFGHTKSGNLIENSAQETIGINLAAQANLNLKSSGKIGDILGQGIISIDAGQAIEVVAMSDSGSQLVGQRLNNNGQLTVDNVDVDTLKLNNSSTLTAKNVSAQQLDAASATANADSFEVGVANLTNAQINAQNFVATELATIDKSSQLQVTDTLKLGKGMQIQGDASVTAANLLVSGGNVNVGTEAIDGKSGSSASLVANNLDLNGNSLILDPEFGQKTATAFIQNFKDLDQALLDNNSQTPPEQSTTTALRLNGNIIVGRNSALGLGGSEDEFKAALAKLQDSNGSLKNGQDDVGALAYVNQTQVELNGNKLIVGTEDVETLKAKLSETDSIYLGQQGGLQIGVKALGEAQTNKTLIFSDLTSEQTIRSEGGKLIVPAGTTSKDLATIFGSEVQLAADTTLTVQTDNGAFVGTVDSSDDLHGSGDFIMSTTSNSRKILSQMSNPTYNFYTNLMTANQNESTLTKNSAEVLADNNEPTVEDTENTQTPSSTNAKDDALQFITAAGSQGTGLALEQAARLANLGVSVQIANQISQTGSDAIMQRVAMTSNQQGSGMTVVDNSRSAAWVSPMYQSFNSDKFGADELSYGADIKMYGISAGFDHMLNNGLRLGAMLNFGKGDADGSGIAEGIKNDFSYYGAGLYASVQPLRDLSLTADVTYNKVNNDLEAATNLNEFGNITSSADSSALTAGINAQYRFKAGNLNFTPHAGMRYTRLSLDEYTVAVDGKSIGKIASDDANVFSIPLGIGVSTTLSNGNWVIKPSADLTLTAHFGDDTIDSVTQFNGQEAIKYKSEFMDSISYGAKAGIQMQNGNFSFGANVGYTGSSNTDEFSIGANARLAF